MRDDQVAALGGELKGFVAEIFASLLRKDQREKSSLYLRGWMLDGQRKSLQPMAERLGVDHQQLQQFTTSSTWAVEPVRREIAGLAIGLIAPEAWVIDDIGFAKEGTSLPGVARQYSKDTGEDRQLPDRRVPARCHRCCVLPVELAPVPSRGLG